MQKKVYALKDIFNQKSASGGAFPVIVKAFAGHYQLDINDYVVYGAAFDGDLNVRHIRVQGNDLDQLSGSKYIESIFNDSLREAIEDIRANKWVVFSGTPCQIDALKKNVMNHGLSLERVLLIDIICHGTPSLKYWISFKKWIEGKHKTKIVGFCFRHRKPKWRQYSLKCSFDNSNILNNSFDLQIYMQLFFSKLIMKECCFKCHYSNMDRVSDITIGDFWGIDKCIPDFCEKRHVSEVIVNTRLGEVIMDYIDRNKERDFQGLLLRKCTTRKYIEYQHNLCSPTERPWNKDEFEKDFKIFGFEYVAKKYGGNNIKGRIRYYKHCVGEFLRYYFE